MKLVGLNVYMTNLATHKNFPSSSKVTMMAPSPWRKINNFTIVLNTSQSGGTGYEIW